MPDSCHMTPLQEKMHDIADYLNSLIGDDDSLIIDGRGDGGSGCSWFIIDEEGSKLTITISPADLGSHESDETRRRKEQCLTS